MADRVLPSREAVRHSDNIHDFPTYLERVLLPLAQAWQSGRLVDREAIDYEALARYEHTRYRLAANAFYEEEIVPWDDLGAGSRAGLVAGVRHRVDAALEVSDG